MENSLWIFAVQSYGAMSSFDNGETNEDFDQEPVIVGHQYAPNRHEALNAMAEELASNLWGLEKPDFYDKDEPTDEEQEEISEYDDKIDSIKNELQFFELVVGGEHTTLFMS